MGRSGFIRSIIILGVASVYVYTLVSSQNPCAGAQNYTACLSEHQQIPIPQTQVTSSAPIIQQAIVPKIISQKKITVSSNTPAEVNTAAQQEAESNLAAQQQAIALAKQQEAEALAQQQLAH